MKRFHLWLASGLVMAAAAPASAQVSDYPRAPYSYLRPPVLSPYLNLALGRDPAVNYFLGVRSEMDRRINNRILGNTILDFERRYEQPEGQLEPFPRLSETGHPTAFMNYGSFYNMGRPPAAPARRNR